MSFLCPECSTPKAMNITAQLELPPDSWWDEMTLQVVECSRCGFAAAAVYQESRRGALDSEAVNHEAYRVSADGVTKLKNMIEQCPKPNDCYCTCSSHRMLTTQDALGRWNGLNAIGGEGTFELTL